MSDEKFRPVLTLNSQREIVSGNVTELRRAISNGADLRIFTSFRHNEHIDTSSDNPEWINEVSDFRVTWLIDGRWVAGIMNLRMPVTPPVDFGARPSWSFFMYNEDGTQAIARPFLDGTPGSPSTGRSPDVAPENMPKYHVISTFDTGTNAPSQNFVYDFGEFRYYVRDCWHEVYAHDGDGRTISGSFDELIRAFNNGAEFKAAISGFDQEPGEPVGELFTPLGSGYHNTESGIFSITSQPVVMVKPAIPMRYAAGNWSFGNLLLRTDGEVVYWRCDPYNMKYEKVRRRCTIRYFFRD